MKLKRLLSTCVVTLFLISCGDDQVPTPPFSHNVSLTMDNIANIYTIKESHSAHSGKNICHVDSGINWGVGYTFMIPDSLLGKSLAVKISAWVRTGSLDNSCDIICGASSNDSINFWQGFGAKSVMTTPHEWANVNGTLTLPSHVNSSPNSKIVIMANNVDAKSYFDVDDLEITYFEIRK